MLTNWSVMDSVCSRFTTKTRHKTIKILEINSKTKLRETNYSSGEAKAEELFNNKSFGLLRALPREESEPSCS